MIKLLLTKICQLLRFKYFMNIFTIIFYHLSVIVLGKFKVSVRKYILNNTEIIVFLGCWTLFIYLILMCKQYLKFLCIHYIGFSVNLIIVFLLLHQNVHYFLLQVKYWLDRALFLGMFLTVLLVWKLQEFEGLPENLLGLLQLTGVGEFFSFICLQEDQDKHRPLQNQQEKSSSHLQVFKLL